MHRLPLTLSYSKNQELSSMGVGAGLYMYDIVVKRSRSLSHLLISSCIGLIQSRSWCRFWWYCIYLSEMFVGSHQ